jgi:hypothetical protein
MSTGAGTVSPSESNSNMGSAAKHGVKVKRLRGPAVGKTGQKNSGMKFTRRG